MTLVPLAHACPASDVAVLAPAGTLTLQGHHPREPDGGDEVVTRDRLQAVAAYERAWSLPDAGKIRGELARCWTASSTHTTPLTDTVRGVEGLTSLILDFPVMFPGATFRVTGPPDLHHDVARFAWRRQSTARIRTLGRDFGYAIDGLDYLEFDRQNRIRRVIAFFGPLTPDPPAETEPANWSRSGSPNPTGLPWRSALNHSALDHPRQDTGHRHDRSSAATAPTDPDPARRDRRPCVEVNRLDLADAYPRPTSDVRCREDSTRRGSKSHL